MERTRVVVEEVGLREGLQSHAVLLSLERKIELVELFLAAGLRHIQLGSFVNPKKVPQMAGVEDLFRHYRDRQDAVFSALVLNRRGFDRALDCGVRALHVSLSASATHQRENAGRSIVESLTELCAVVREARQAGMRVKGGVQAAFGCYLEGPVAADQVIRIASALAEAGAAEVNLADTAGVARPGEIQEVIGAVRKALPAVKLSLHLHNTLGMAPASVTAALNLGVTRFDGAAAGLGGCPFMQGAEGNIATEDLVFLLQSLGLARDLDIARLCVAAARARELFGAAGGGKLGAHFPRLAALGLVR